ncbi:MAG: HAMP domain-containing protein [Thermoleophilia bacterium]|nr:HAMP domain-containing protein [Thermoleophilia bacterium]
MRSLRFRLPAFFLLGAVAAGIVTAAITVQLFQDYTKDQTVADLRRQASALAALYEAQAVQSVDEGTAPPRFAAARLELAAGARLYYVGVELFPGRFSGLRALSLAEAGLEELPGRPATVELTPPGETHSYLAVVQPVRLGGETFGALVVAKPKAELADRWLVLAWRGGLAFLGGLGVAAGLSLYLSRRVTRPVLELSRAADEVAAGRYETAVPAVRSRDEIGHLADRFREMTDRLAEASELERNFLMTVSHELRTPLTAIRGHVDALREGLADDAEVREASLEVIRAETDRLARLVGDLLDLAKLDARRFTLVREEVDLGRLLEQAAQALGEEARCRGIALECRLDLAPVIETDGDRVLQVVTNLLANAIQWTPDGGTVSLSLAAADGRVTVAVEDSGPGIPPEELERVFRPFWSRNGQGTGLGLAIARELAQALGGRLELESELGRGSRFVLALPAAGG